MKQTKDIIPNKSENEEYPFLSNVRCYFCKRRLLYDPRQPMTVDIGKKIWDYDDWCFEGPIERYEFVWDDLIINCEIHGPVHEVCDFDFHHPRKAKD